ncbi:MAG: hypothetical protein Fur0016_09400 [Anaerolineales bacterium]
MQGDAKRNDRDAGFKRQPGYPGAGGVEFAGRADESFGENHHRAASFKRLAGFFQHALTLLRHDRNLLQLAV